jgi:hypothetical protein
LLIALKAVFCSKIFFEFYIFELIFNLNREMEEEFNKLNKLIVETKNYSYYFYLLSHEQIINIVSKAESINYVKNDLIIINDKFVIEKNDYDAITLPYLDWDTTARDLTERPIGYLIYTRIHKPVLESRTID